MPRNTLPVFLRKKNSPSSMEGIHYGFIADDSIGSAYQAVMEGVLRDEKNAVLRALRVAIDGSSKNG